MKNKYQNLKSLKFFYKPYRIKIALFAIFTFLSSGIALAYPFISSEIILNLTGQPPKIPADYTKMIIFCAVLLSAIALNTALYFTADYLHAKITNSLLFDVRKKVISKMMDLKLSVVYDAGSGYFLERLSEDAKEVSVNRLDIYKQIIELTVSLSFIFYITALDWRIGLIFAGGIAVLIVLEYMRVSNLLKNKKLSKRAAEKVKVAENEIIKGIKEIKGLNAKEALIEKHSLASKNFTTIKYKREMYNQKMQKVIDVVKAVIDFSLLVIAAAYLLAKPGQIPSPGQLTVAGLLVVYNFKGNIYGLIAGFAKLKDHYVNGELAAKRINDVILAEPHKLDEFGTEELKCPVEKIEFNDVAFEYTEGKPILKDIDLTIEKNSLVGFVGKSGSGKSTIFSLLTNFFKVKSGEILINGIPLKNLNEQSLRNHIAPVLQDPYIFNDTIFNNVKFAKPDSTEEEIIKACKGALLHDEILLMDNGYQTLIGENGSNLSGGQKQRLEIARILLKNTDVLLFDEATSALDKNNLTKINSLLVKLKETKIVLVIAHRLNVMRLCDKVFVLDEGEIIAHGRHDELLETSAYYQDLFKRGSQQDNTKE